jgi:hypothetical protein
MSYCAVKIVHYFIVKIYHIIAINISEKYLKVKNQALLSEKEEYEIKPIKTL